MTDTNINKILSNFSFNYKDIVIDEIALDGLEGIGLDLLWKRIEKRISTNITVKLKIRLWKFIINSSKVSFYYLPESLPRVEILDRFTIIHEVSGQLKEPDIYPDGPYEYCPINNEYGSCKYYSTRTLIPNKELQCLSYEKLVDEYGDRLVIVANLEERWRALAGHLPISQLSFLTSVHYCILELVGRARENGQMTIGNTNLSKVVKDSKTLFYNRKSLQDLDLIRVQQITQIIGTKGVKSLLLRLKRFHKTSIPSMPKCGILHDIAEYLLKKPNYSEKTEVLIKEGLLNAKLSKKLQKTVNIFSFAEKTVTVEDNSKSKKPRIVKKKIISLSCNSDESSQSDDEPYETPLKCQYKVGVNLLLQAYEKFLDAGLKGLTQIQLAQLLGVEFYTSRAICRLFRLKKIVREYLEDKGKQRTARYIAIVATGNIDTKYATEKEKLLRYLEKDHNVTENTEPEASTYTSDDEIPLKKMKLEDLENNMQVGDDEATESIVTEVKVLDGCEGVMPLGSSKKNPTLRQLTFANGILKVLKDQLCVTGYQTLSNLASKEINEPPMDTKCLKIFIQKLIMDGYVKTYKMKWPGIQKYSVLICAHHVKCTDPVIKGKYKEICIRAAGNKSFRFKKDLAETRNKPYMHYTYPRYMKIQKLHENIMQIAYFEYIKPESHTLSQGFISIVDLIPELSLEFIINNVSNMSDIDISQLKITEDQLQAKFRDAPTHAYKALMRSVALHNAIRMSLRVLAMLGLVQLISQYPKSEPSSSSLRSSFIFYVNRKAKILNTTGIWPKTSHEVIIEKSYYFETPDDVANYWNDVYEISTSTTVTTTERKKKILPPLRIESEVKKYDNGDRHGDGLGPCGFDACFYMDMLRFWRTFYLRPPKSLYNKNITLRPKIKKVKKQIPKTKPKPKRPSSVVKETEPREKVQRIRMEGYMKWSKQEDMIITMCKAAITIMSPCSQAGSLIIRNSVAKDLININDPGKTKAMCHSRAQTLENNLTLVHEKQCILNELRRKRELILKYENLLKRLRIRYPANMSKLINNARLPMMELVWLISRIMCSKSYTQRTPCVALNNDEFHKNFTIVTSTVNKHYNTYKTLDNSTLKELIVFTVLLSFDCELTAKMAKQIYLTFKSYPENDLRIAIEQIRKSGAISAKDKIVHNQQNRRDLDDMVQSCYKVSASYQRVWANKLNSDFVENLGDLLEQENLREFKGSPEINCLFCEMQANGALEIASATIPMITDSMSPSSHSKCIQDEMNAIIIETKFRLKSGTLTWRNKYKDDIKKLSEFYQNIDIENIMESRTRPFVLNLSENQDVMGDDVVINHLKLKAHKGATFYELQEISGLQTKSLIEKITELVSKNIATAVGFYETVIVLNRFAKPWCAKFQKKYIIPYPWLSFDLKIRNDIYLKWTSSVMNKIFEMPGVTISQLSDKFEFITCRSIQDVCIFLERCKCVELLTVRSRRQDLFSEVDDEPEFEEYNCYAPPENIIVFPVKDSLTKFAYIRKKILATL